MGKKRATAVSAVPFPAPAAEPEREPDHFSDYGFDPQLIHFFCQPEAKRLWGRRHHQPAQWSKSNKPLEPARFKFKLQKPISKKDHPQKKQQRRRWWSSAASAALLLFKRPSSSARPAAAPSPPYGSVASTTVPLYLTDDDGAAARTCWPPAAVRSGRLAAAELGAAAGAVPYISLRSASLGSGGAGGAGGAPAMPIYLVT